MNPRALAAWSLAALCIALSTNNPVYRALVLLSALNVLLTLRRPEVRLRPLGLAIAVAAATSLLLNVLLSHAGAHLIITLPAAIPALGGSLTLEAIVFGAATALGIAAALAAAGALSVVNQPHELVDALPPQLARVGAALGTALNLMPALGRSAVEIRDAQRMRGWRARRAREWPDVAVPVLLTALEQSLTLAEAMEARGYGAGPRTHLQPHARSRRDGIAGGVALLAAAAFLCLRIAGVIGDWYPFPSLSIPPVNAAAIACCVLLALPALQRRR